MKCPKCGSEEHRLAGYTENGVHRLQCKECSYRYVAHNYTPEQFEQIYFRKPDGSLIKCPHCKSACIVKHGKYRGEQKYLCKMCSKSFRLGQKAPHLDKTKRDVRCPYCNSDHLWIRDKTKAGNQIYYCPECKKKFTPDARIKHLTDKDKVFILRYYYVFGYSMNAIAKHMKRTVGTVASFIKRYERKKNGQSTNIDA